jgi:hypothetical protein
MCYDEWNRGSYLGEQGTIHATNSEHDQNHDVMGSFNDGKGALGEFGRYGDCWKRGR